VRHLKANAERDITVDGPELAAQAIRAGLVDEFQPIVCPVIVGGGKRFFPTGVRLDLDLLDERRLRSGVVVSRYAVRR
jgi:dihydrofolate reductase